MISTTHKLDSRTIIGFITIVVLLGANFVAVRFSNAELVPFWGAALRFSLATLILGAVMSVRHIAFPRGQELRATLVYGVLNFGISYALLYWALLSVPSGMTAVIFSTLPLVTLLFATWVNTEQLDKQNILGAVVAIMGISLVFSEQLRLAVPPAGVLAVMIAVIVSAIASVLVKRMQKPHPVTLNAVGMGAGTLILLLSSLIAHEPLRLPTLPVTWAALGWLTMSAIVAFLLFVWIIGRWTASAATYALVLAPLVTIVLGSWLIREPVTVKIVLGSLVVLAGTYIGTARSVL